MANVTHATRKDPTVRRICDAIGFTGNRIKLEGAESVELWGTQWDGGTRNVYAAIDLGTMTAVSMPATPYGGADNYVTIPAGVVICRVTQGSYSALTVYVRPDNLTAMLPPADAITETEALVLVATASLKNTYGGEKDIRYRTVARKFGTTREAWEAAQAALIAKGMLNRAGAITADGRNAVESHPLRHSL